MENEVISAVFIYPRGEKFVTYFGKRAKSKLLHEFVFHLENPPQTRRETGTGQRLSLVWERLDRDRTGLLWTRMDQWTRDTG